MFAAKVNRMTTLEVLRLEFWDGDAFSSKLSQGRVQVFEVCFLGQNDYVAVAAKLRCAV
jgi:hypothetical protein